MLLKITFDHLAETRTYDRPNNEILSFVLLLITYFLTTSNRIH